MMIWYGHGMSGWGYGLMTASMILFWLLVVAGIVALVRYAGTTTPGPTPPMRPGAAATPQQILAERYARGEIDEEEYTRRLKTLNTAPPA